MSDRNLNPHAEARVARVLWYDRYSKQKLGCMDFYDGLTPAQKSTCAQIVDGIIYADRADGRTPAPAELSVGIIAAFEAAYPELYYHVAKGKITAGEPLYGAIITMMGGTEIGHGESDISAGEAFRIAIDDAGLTIAKLEDQR